MNYKIISLLASLSISAQAFAICEHERNEFHDWNSKCEKLARSSQIAGTAGGFFSIATFGASLVPCAALTAAAANACRIRDEKRNNLSRCEEVHAQINREQQQEAERLMHAEQERNLKVQAINAKYQEQKQTVTAEYKTRLENFVKTYNDESWDIHSEESQTYLANTKTGFEQERNQKLAELDSERIKEINSL